MRLESNLVIVRDSKQEGFIVSRKIDVWLNADGGNDIYATIEVEDDATDEVIEKEAKQAIFNYVDWGWVEQEGE